MDVKMFAEQEMEVVFPARVNPIYSERCTEYAAWLKKNFRKLYTELKGSMNM